MRIFILPIGLLLVGIFHLSIILISHVLKTNRRKIWQEISFSVVIVTIGILTLYDSYIEYHVAEDNSVILRLSQEEINTIMDSLSSETKVEGTIKK